MEIKPAAFMSYAHIDDADGRLTEFRKRLSRETHMQIGEEFPIFQDRDDIHWGQSWRERIENSLDQVTFLIPIITPSFFNSQHCRDELQRFLDREKELDRNDLVLPVYYVDAPLLNNEAKLANDKLARTIAARQHVDWRDLRIEPFTSPQVVKMLTGLGTQIRDALERVQELRGRTGPNLAPDTRGQQTSGASLSQKQRGEPVAEGGTTPRRPAAKIEPPTHVVDQMHRGDHSTITAAIEAAKPGDRILVRPGFYQEGLVIDKPLEIVGEGDLDEIVVRASGKNALLFQTTIGRVTNLTLRQVGGEDWYGVDITQGRLELEGCDISSESLSCVAIHGGADPRLRRNRIRDGKGAGVLVTENGQGTLEDNEIFGNALSGVEISEGGDPTLRRNRIHDGKGAGVLVTENGQGTLEDNEIFANAFAGVEISEGGADPRLRRNRIRDGKGAGVLVTENGQGTLEDNEIFGNALSGVEISEGGDPTLRRNRIHDGKGDGVYVHENGQGTLEDNEIFGNALSGVAIETGGDPTLRRNRIRDGKQSGVFVTENGRGTLEDNDIFGNAHAGVAIEKGGNPTLRHNRINKNGREAVWVGEDGGGTVEDNDLRDNALGAWDVSADSRPNLKRARNEE